MTDRQTSPAYLLSRVLVVAAIGWFGYMAYVVWDIYAAGYINPLIPTWNSLFAVGMAAVGVQVFKNREWARRWMQSATLCTAAMNLMVATKPGGGAYWFGVVTLALCAWALHTSREDYGERDDGRQPNRAARVFALVLLVGTILVAVAPRSLFS